MSNSKICSNYRKYFRDNCVCTKGVLLFFVWSAAIHSFGYYPVLFLVTIQSVNDSISVKYIRLPLLGVTSLVYLFYPVMGLLADVYWTRYKVMVAGTFLALVGVLIAVPPFAILLLVQQEFISTYHLTTPLVVIGCIGVGLYQFGLGLFRANAIQLGTDQLQFSCSEKLSSFVYFYYWSTQVLRFPCYIFLCSYFSMNKFELLFLAKFLAVCLLCLSMVFISIPLICYCCCCLNRNLVTLSTSHDNPIKLIYKVLLFVKKHQIPVSRSAFTYGEVPTRMEYAKERYGGPFTTEQVEDVKTFGRIVLLLATLFGGLLRPTVNRLDFLNRHLVLSSFYREMESLHFLQLLIIIPIYLVLVRPLAVNCTSRITLVKKIHVGLILGTVSHLLVIPANIDPNNEYISLVYATVSVIVYPICYFLVFLSVLEFILAQGPERMQGFLIGLWYAYQSLVWLFYLSSLYLPHLEIIKTVLSLTSLGLFSIVSMKYKYRQRNEVSDINRQAIIEDYTARALNMENSTPLFSNTTSFAVNSI